MLDLHNNMARKRPVHQKHVPHFLSAALLVTGIMAVLAVAGYAYKMNNNSEVASATTYNGRYALRICDVDNNKRVTKKDYDTIRGCANRAKSCTTRLKSRSDINKDKRINKNDLTAFRSGCVPSKPTPVPTRVIVDPDNCNFKRCPTPPVRPTNTPTPEFVEPDYEKPQPVIHVDPYCAFFGLPCEPCDFTPEGCSWRPTPPPAKPIK